MMAQQYLNVEDRNSTITDTDIGAVLKYPKEASVIAATCAVLFVVLGVVGNTLTIAALAKCPKLKSQATTWFVVSLSVSDLIFCAFNLPLTATRFIFQAWIFDDLLCKIFPFLFYANFGASLFHIMLIAINRYMLISSYTRYKKLYKPLYVSLMIAAVWAFSFLILIPPLLGFWGTMGLDEETYSCTILKKDGRSPKKFLFIFGIMPPLAIVIYCYTKILSNVQRSKRVLRRIQASSGVPCQTSPTTSDDLKLTKTMALIITCFLLCFVPVMIGNVIDDKISWPGVHIAASIFAWASAVINPIIYSVSSKTYRSAYYSLLGCSREEDVQLRVTASGGQRTTTSDVAVGV